MARWAAASGWHAHDLHTEPVVTPGICEQRSTHQTCACTCTCDLATQIPPNGFAVHCLDKANAAELRSATRSAHLEWLAESGRIHLGGALHR
jgi:hypothetical protein